MAVSVAPSGGRRPQRSKAIGADVEDVAGIERQHRGHAAEQHREQIERDRSKDQPVAADIGEAVDHLLPWRAGLQRRARQSARS